MSTLVALAGVTTVVITVVLSAASVGIPSEVSLPLLVLAVIAVRSLRIKQA